MIVVSDTTAISTLYLINRLEWLEALFGQILIPQAVHAELIELESAGHDLQVIRKADWIKVHEVKNRQLVEQLLQNLDIGESEAIVLAMETQADYLLIDERKGSRQADALGIPTIGLLRVILELKSRQIIPEVKAVLDEIVDTGGFWMSDRLYARVLAAAGEGTSSKKLE